MLILCCNYIIVIMTYWSCYTHIAQNLLENILPNYNSDNINRSKAILAHVWSAYIWRKNHPTMPFGIDWLKHIWNLHLPCDISHFCDLRNSVCHMIIISFVWKIQGLLLLNNGGVMLFKDRVCLFIPLY